MIVPVQSQHTSADFAVFGSRISIHFVPRAPLVAAVLWSFASGPASIWLGVAGCQDQASPTDGIIEMGYTPPPKKKKHVLTLLLDIQV